MRVLIITGDTTFVPGHPRYDLQKQYVDELDVVYWGGGHIWPKVPKKPYDVLSTQDPFWRGLFGLLISRIRKVPLNVQVHADVSGQSVVKKLLARFVLRQAVSVRVVSQKIKEQVQAFGVTAPITILPVFIDAGSFTSVIRKSHTGKKILWVGRMEEEKNPLLALTVFKEVLKEVPDAQLVMLGSGSLSEKVAACAAELPVQESLHRPGWQNPALYMDTADVVLCTSNFESWGASIVEALAAGVPVVAPDVGVAREAGARVVPRERLAKEVIQVLYSNEQGVLKLALPTASQWGKLWRESLLPVKVSA